MWFCHLASVLLVNRTVMVWPVMPVVSGLDHRGRPAVSGRTGAVDDRMLGDPTVHGDRSRRTRIDGTDGSELRNIHHVIGLVERRL